MVKKVDFGKPPVVEVVCGVGLGLSKRLMAGHIGLFWDRIKDQFPNLEEAPPLPPPQRPETFTIEVSNLPPLPRTWFSSEDGSRLIQIQGDRFVYNWKREEDEAEYPNFDKIYAKFQEILSQFIDFLEISGYGKPRYNYLELQYVNHIGPWNGLDAVGSSGVLADHSHLKNSARFLPLPVAYNWQSHYELPEGLGHLYVTTQTAISRPTGESVVRLEMATRGSPKDSSASSFDEWFDLAHDWIVLGFCDLTVPELHKIWRRKQ